MEQEKGEEEKEAKNVANLIYLDGEVIFVSAFKYFLCLCKIQLRDYSSLTRVFPQQIVNFSTLLWPSANPPSRSQNNYVYVHCF